jgi:hypothetical protein
MTWEDIISRFNLQVDDSSELSDSESLALANEVYRDIQNDRNWEWLKKEYTGVQSTSVDYITLPTDFRTLSPNKEGVSVVFVWTRNEEYKVIPFSSRRDYRDRNGYCYINAGKLYFTVQPTAANVVEFDYIKKCDDLTTSTSPVFPDEFHIIISYWMSARFDAIQLTNKWESYAPENEKRYMSLLSSMRLQDANIKLGIS